MQPLHLAGLVLLALFIAWRLHGRVRRLLTRQPLHPWRTRLRAGLFLYIGAGLLASTWGLWPSFASFAAAYGAGMALALLGLRRTRFEDAPDGLHFTPDMRIGIGLSLLLAARILWRLGELALHGLPRHAATVDELLHSPVTLAVLGLLAGYYAAYALGVLRWRRGVLAARAA